MLNNKLLDEFSSHFSAMIANSPARDLEKNARAFLASSLSRLDLVTREEFEVQAALLQTAQQRLKQLEERLSQLETAKD